MKTYVIPILALILFCTACGKGSNRSSSKTATSADKVSPAPESEASATADASEKEDAMADEDHQSLSKQPGQITAGEWHDQDHWDFWQSLMKQDVYGEMQNHWSFNLDQHISVQTINDQGKPVADVPVRLLSADEEVLWQGRTNNKGIVDLFPFLKDNQRKNAQTFKVQAGDGPVQKLKFAQGDETRLIVADRQPKPILDAAFVVDATGSMGDEMDYLKAELTDVIKHVADDNSGLEINTGAVFYRDEDDDYLTRKSGFTTDIAETVRFIKKQEADGGGDFPEAVHSALDVALNELEWSQKAQARILFLVLDAPPHHDAAIIRKVNQLIKLAGSKGVRIVPVVSSGIDKETEFLMRYMAIATGGTYVFLTDDSGIGNSHLQPTVGKYEVEYLNALLIRVIDGYVAMNNNEQY